MQLYEDPLDRPEQPMVRQPLVSCLAAWSASQVDCRHLAWLNIELYAFASKSWITFEFQLKAEDHQFNADSST